MEHFIKNAYDQGAAQALADFGIKIAKFTPAMEASLERLRQLDLAGTATPKQIEQMRYLSDLQQAKQRGARAASELAFGEKFRRSGATSYTPGGSGPVTYTAPQVQENVAQNVYRNMEAGRVDKQLASTRNLPQGSGSLAAADRAAGALSPKEQSEVIKRQVAAREAAGLNQYGGKAGTQGRSALSILERLKNMPTKGKAGLAAGGLGLLGLGAYAAS